MSLIVSKDSPKSSQPKLFAQSLAQFLRGEHYFLEAFLCARQPPTQAAYIEGVVHHLLRIFRLRQKSLVRAVLLSLGAFAASLHLAGFPHIESLHGSYWQILALLVAVWGMAETARCLQRKWSFYHAGVLILLYSELMILAAIVLMLFAP